MTLDDESCVVAEIGGQEDGHSDRRASAGGGDEGPSGRAAGPHRQSERDLLGPAGSLARQQGAAGRVPRGRARRRRGRHGRDADDRQRRPRRRRAGQLDRRHARPGRALQRPAIRRTLRTRSAAILSDVYPRDAMLARVL